MRGRGPIYPSEYGLDFRFGKGLAIGVKFGQQFGLRFHEGRENLVKFYKRTAKGTNPLQVLSQP
jgi:hypothetical protein